MKMFDLREGNAFDGHLDTIEMYKDDFVENLANILLKYGSNSPQIEGIKTMFDETDWDEIMEDAFIRCYVIRNVELF